MPLARPEQPNSGFIQHTSHEAQYTSQPVALTFASHSKKKNSECCPSNQVSAAAMTSATDEKWRSFDCFFQSREHVIVRWGQIRRIGWLIKTLEIRQASFIWGASARLTVALSCKNKTHLVNFPRCFFFKMSFNCTRPADMSNTSR